MYICHAVTYFFGVLCTYVFDMQLLKFLHLKWPTLQVKNDYLTPYETQTYSCMDVCAWKLTS